MGSHACQVTGLRRWEARGDTAACQVEACGKAARAEYSPASRNECTVAAGGEIAHARDSSHALNTHTHTHTAAGGEARTVDRSFLLTCSYSAFRLSAATECIVFASGQWTRPDGPKRTSSRPASPSPPAWRDRAWRPLAGESAWQIPTPAPSLHARRGRRGQRAHSRARVAGRHRERARQVLGNRLGGLARSAHARRPFAHTA